jgi:hypothetical protein
VSASFLAISKRHQLTFISRHVAKTGDIKGFVITEESGIAKGIRRIVAVTGHEAQEVTRQAENFQERLSQLEGLDGKSKDTALKALTVVCLPAIRSHYVSLTLFVGTWTFRYLSSQESRVEGKGERCPESFGQGD